MSEELAIRQRDDVQAPPINAEQNVLSVIARAAQDPSVDVDKMRALLDMQERVIRITAEREFKAALARIQPQMPRVTKYGRIEVDKKLRSRFARLEDVDAAIRPLLAIEGFAVNFDTEHAPGLLKVKMEVSHSAGHSEYRQITLPLDTSGSKNSTQSVGSTISYGKRYLLCAFFNIITVDEDDDGAGVQFITEDQVRTLEALMTEVRANRAAFLHLMCVNSLEQLDARDFQKAVRFMEAKRK